MTRSTSRAVCWSGLAILAAAGSAQARSHPARTGSTPASPAPPQPSGQEQAPSGGVSEAATGNTAGPGDIVVTANRRQEAQSRVPISVTAFNQRTLDTLAVKEFADVSRITPGVTFRESFAGSSNIAIRGISSLVGASTTGIYIDDTPIQARQMGTAQAASGTYPTIFDLERVEILRGPQGTLFGSGSEGGTVRFITPNPSLTKFSSYGRAEIGFTEHGDPSYEAGAAVGGPLVPDKIGFRASAFYRRDGGYVDRIPFAPGYASESNSNYATTLALRGALTFTPTDNLTITPSIFYQRRRDNDTDLVWANLSDTNNGRFRNGFIANQPRRDSFVLPSLKAELNLGKVSVFSSTSYFDRSYPFAAEYETFILSLLLPVAPGYSGSSFFLSSVPNYFVESYNFGHQRAFTQEVRIQSNNPLSRFNWVIGGFYQHSRQRFDQYVYDPLLPQVTNALFGATPAQIFGVGLVSPGFSGVPQGANYSLVGLETTLDRQLAGFGQAEFLIAPGLKILAGVRVAETRFEFSNSKNGPFNGGFVATSGAQKETPVTPKVGVNYEPRAGQLFYATAAKGFRTGGANPAVTTLCRPDLSALGLAAAPASYQSDSVWSYEAGNKSRLFGNKVRLDASLFYVNWKNIQQQVRLNSCGFNYVANLGTAVSKGFDVQASVQPTPELTVGGTLGYTDAHFTRSTYSGANNQGLLATRGDRLAVPDWHVTASVDYEHALGTGATAYLHGDYQYESAYKTLPSAPSISADPLIENAAATHFASARAGVRLRSIDASVFVKNLFNSVDPLYYTRIDLGSTLFQSSTFRPRTIGLTVSFRN